jgi:hypothetical protein
MIKNRSIPNTNLPLTESPREVFGLYNSLEHISDLKEFLLLDINSDFSYPKDNLKPHLFERYNIKSVYFLEKGVKLYTLELQ